MTASGVTVPSTVPELVRTAEEGVYLTEVVRALLPAAADAEAANEVEAPAPVAPDEALPWM